MRKLWKDAHVHPEEFLNKHGGISARSMTIDGVGILFGPHYYMDGSMLDKILTKIQTERVQNFFLLLPLSDRHPTRGPGIILNEDARRRLQERRLAELQQDNYAAEIPDEFDMEAISQARKKRIADEEEPAGM